MSERYIEICDWDRFQHKDVWRKSGGRPPWIKAYTGLLHNDKWLELSQSQRGALLGLWLMYASSGEAVSSTRSRHLLSTHKGDSRHYLDTLEALSSAGFIRFVSRPISAPVAPRVEESREEPPLPPLAGGNGFHPERISVKGYTGCRFVRGEVGMAAKYDPLGRDRPPSDWPHDKPSRDEIRKALKERDAIPF